MIFRKSFLEKIKRGEVKVAYRRWTRASVKTGGTLKTPVGVLKFTSVRPIAMGSLKPVHSRRAGYASFEALQKELRARKDGRVYEIKFEYAGEDPRLKLRAQNRLGKEELEQVLSALHRLDKASRRGPWVLEVLQLIEKYPAVRAGNLAPQTPFPDTPTFKINVRKLKAKGLTISLEVGYKLSPRGEVILKALSQRNR